MKTEYFLLCKKNYYTSNKSFINLINPFKNVMFVKGQKYKVIKETIKTYGVPGTYWSSCLSPSVSGLSGSTIIYNPPYSGSTFNSNTTSTTTACTSTTSTTYSSNYSWNNYSVNGVPVTEDFISEYFYTLKEERQLKLKKLSVL